MKLRNNHILKYLSIVIIFTSWIIFYTIPRDLQYPLFFIPAIVLIFYSFYPYKKENVIAFILFGVVIFRFFIPEDFSLTNISFWAAMIRAILISSLFLIDRESLMKMYGYFRKYLFYIVIISLPFYLLYIAGLLPIGQIATHVGGDGEGRTWNVYLFFSLQDHPIRGEITRFPAIFDEAGFLGTLLALILIIEKLNMTTKENKTFLFSGILTFSLAFYLIIFVYYFFNKEYDLKNKIYLGVISVILLMISYFLFQEIFTSRVLDRLFTDDSITIIEDNRIGLGTQQMIISGLKTIDSKLLLFGGGYQASEGISFVSATTWVNLVFQLGFVFICLFTIFSFIFVNKNINNLIFLFAFYASVLQRPAIFYPLWFFIFIVGIKIRYK
ncbi:hypothetical protein QLX67_06755 [Balneolaceae bacterium ANBcel3]|nr:hypothetical protein [Balneolaceae bacterium ANBcel3]